MLLQFLGAAYRCWFVVVLGALLTVGWCAFALATPPVYWTRSHVVFAAPGVSEERAYFVPPSDTVVPLVAAVERVVNDGRPVTRFASDEATLYGLGVREGVSVYLLNAGNQWISMFPSPVLVIETVDENVEEALLTHQEARLEIAAAAAQLQQDAGVPAAKRVRPVNLLEDPTVQGVGSTRRGEAMTVGAGGLAGGLLTCGAVILLDRRRLRPAQGGAARHQEDVALLA